ncbi:unnamed protein product [Lactuca saligna]|uniref:Apple domain-containing protein n=1 Tax=Lactuca saligna TaxID=75948 RepID=A0AA35ZD21_LACSI|nr:unnamed protein product [Lactuca saligna]
MVTNQMKWLLAWQAPQCELWEKVRLAQSKQNLQVWRAWETNHVKGCGHGCLMVSLDTGAAVGIGTVTGADASGAVSATESLAKRFGDCFGISTDSLSMELVLVAMVTGGAGVVPSRWQLEPSTARSLCGYHMNENESYIIYFVDDPSIITRFVMDVSGQVQQLAWMETGKDWNLLWSQPKTRCDVSEIDWDQSDFSGGCVRKTDLQCSGKLEKADFVMIKDDNPSPNNSIAVGSVGECRTICLNNCSGNAYTFVDNQCLLWMEIS